ncbi:MAG: fumarylacetoacetate hydrolase family protein [Dehalococcoidia bacterium]|nr:fumarylacetoacetate hydrolase family protein [Dehalococcoidia bacterium]
MKLVRIDWQGSPIWGIVEGDSVFALEGDVYGDFTRGGRLCKFSDAVLLAPAEPGTIIACGLNYMETVEQLQVPVPTEPALFFKPASALVNPGEDAFSLPLTTDTRYEAELCAVIKRRAWRVSESEALDYVLGFTCGNDMTLWDLVERDGRLTRAKGYYKSAPLGPVLVTDLNPDEVRIQGRVNGETKQDGNTRSQIFNTARIISHVSAFMPLMPGDVVFTGTPKNGHYPVKVGDVVEVEIDGIGILRNKVVMG